MVLNRIRFPQFSDVNSKVIPHRSTVSRSTRALFSLVLMVAVTGADAGEADCQTPDRHVRRTVGVMGTLATIEIWASTEATARDASDAVVRELTRVEDLLSTWRDDTELSALNTLPPGVPAEPSPELDRLLDDVHAWSVRTRGAFSPAVGSLIDAWDLRGAGRRPTSTEITDAVARAGVRGVLYDPEAHTITRLHDAAWLDAGGFGKGAAIRSAADSLKAYGVSRARLDVGGQLLLEGGVPVTIGVAHPDSRGEIAATLRIADASVATSGQSERGVEVEGERFGHIIDPRTGRPVTPWGSVTVVATDALVADVLATALFVLGPDAGIELAEQLDNVGVLFLDDRRTRLRATYNDAMKSYLQDVPGGSIPDSHQSTFREGPI
jgi:thiamine biosynthesis lipoprotein